MKSLVPEESRKRKGEREREREREIGLTLIVYFNDFTVILITKFLPSNNPIQTTFMHFYDACYQQEPLLRV